MSVTQKPLPGADSQHFVAISYPLDWEKTHFIFKMHFEFQKFPRDFNLDSIIRERKSPDPRIEDALRRRMSVCSEPL